MKDSTRKGLRILCTVVFLCAASFLIFYFVKEQKDKEMYEKLKDENKTESQEQIPEQVEETVEIPVDFEELQKMNPDIYAWITIPGTKVDYPILQDEFDDYYYLKHTVEGEYSASGAIYTERQTAQDFSDFNTVIYGHNMKNGTMFRGLHEFKNLDYMKEHPEVIVYTPDAKRVYQIFAAVVYGDNHILNTYDFTQELHRQEFLDSVLNARNMNNCIREDVPVTTDDRILTLSTCIASQGDKRFIVGAVLTDEKKAKNNMD